MVQHSLEILDGERAGEVVALSERLRIGRKPGNDLVIHDEKTSGSHAEVVLEGGRYVLRDLGSTNGTLMEGHKITEVVLTAGDTFQVGRVRMRLRVEGAEGDAAGDAGMTVHRLDQARLQKAGRRRGLAVLVVLLVVAGGAAAWQFLGRGGGESGATPRRRPPLAVQGNRLPAGTGACEDEAGWVLRAGGAGFGTTARAHTGAGALEAVAGEGGEGFALARLEQPITVLKDRPLLLAAHVRTEGGALVGVRMRLFASPEAQSPFEFRVGTPLQAHESWQRVECSAAVPPGADRVEVELVAALPGSGAVALVDDVALTDAGTAQAIALQLEPTGQSLRGAGGGVGIASTDENQRAILLGIRPDGAGGALQPLERAGVLCLTDVGGSVQAETVERGFALRLEGVPALALEFPAEMADGLLIRTDDGAFTNTATDSAFTAREVLMGDGRNRCLLALPQPTAMEGRSSGGRYRLRLPAASLQFVLNFRPERQAAGELLRSAEARAGREPGAAIDQLRELQRLWPHDTDTLRQAQQLRTALQQELADRVRQLRADLEEAAFFDTRGGFARVVEGIDELVRVYGEHNLEDAAAVQAERATAAARIAELDAARNGEAERRLQELARLFREAGQEDLAGLVTRELGRK